MGTIPIVRTLRAYTKRLERGEELTGSELAESLRLLAAHEVAQGGPYARCNSCRVPDLEVNLVAARFLEACGAYLPKLHVYIADQLPSDLSNIREACADELLWFAKRSLEPEQCARRTPEEAQCLSRVYELLGARLGSVASEISETIYAMLAQTIARNADGQMVFMPLYMRAALAEKGNGISNTVIAQHGLASACFWTSFIAYDDFWDEDEAALPAALPATNLMAREYIQHFETVLPKEAGFSEFFHAMMDRLDSANAWEIAHCRVSVRGGVLLVPDTLPAYEDFSIKFYPAAGQCMAPVALLLAAGYSLESPEVSSLIEYFKNYLVAMQLNDDLHDWREDLERGHISTSVAVLLLEWKRVYPERSEITLQDDMRELESVFWYRVVEPICACVLKRTNAAYEALESVGLPNPAPLRRFIDDIQRTGERGLRELRRGEDFLKAMSVENS